MKVQNLGTVGAEISGIDLAALTETELQDLRDLFANQGVLFFREQNLSPDDHLAFADRWGDVNVNRFFTPVANYPRIAEVRKEPEQRFNIGGGWHTDHSYDHVPALGSMLYAKELPPFGGDTLFAGCGAAFASLSAGMQDLLRGLRAVHSSRHVFGETTALPDEISEHFTNANLATQDAEHPVVIKHPLSGRDTLYVNPGFTLHFVNMTAAESAPLLQFLYAQVTRPEHTCRFQWRPGSLAFWDNRATWHFAVNDYPGHRRLMHRITLEGEPLSAVD